VYNYFSSKEEVILAIAQENIGQVISVLRESRWRTCWPRPGCPRGPIAIP
jgi:AcrR family transcriptional regulator